MCHVISPMHIPTCIRIAIVCLCEGLYNLHQYSAVFNLCVYKIYVFIIFYWAMVFKLLLLVQSFFSYD